MRAPRITAALAEYDGITPSGLYINDPHGRRIATALAGEDLATAVREELPPLLERMAAAEAVVEAARIYHQAAPGSDVWDTFDRRVGVTLEAYDELEQGGGGG